MAPQPPRSLNLNDTYPCPLCRHGQIQTLVLTDAFACNFCRHILAADLSKQRVSVIDSTQKITWRWEGQRWRVQHGEQDSHLSMVVISVAVVLTVVPAGVVWLSGLLFPPLSTASSSVTFSMMWAFLTFLTHLGLVLWLVGEHYQIPFYIATKVRLLSQHSMGINR